MAEMLDHVLPFIASRAGAHERSDIPKPFFVALNGVQGAGKTTLVSLSFDIEYEHLSSRQDFRNRIIMSPFLRASVLLYC